MIIYLFLFIFFFVCSFEAKKFATVWTDDKSANVKEKEIKREKRERNNERETCVIGQLDFYFIPFFVVFRTLVYRCRIHIRRMCEYCAATVLWCEYRFLMTQKSVDFVQVFQLVNLIGNNRTIENLEKHFEDLNSVRHHQPI